MRPGVVTEIDFESREKRYAAMEVVKTSAPFAGTFTDAPIEVGTGRRRAAGLITPATEREEAPMQPGARDEADTTSERRGAQAYTGRAPVQQTPE